MEEDWRRQVRSEIARINRKWSQRYGWTPVLKEGGDDHLDLYVTFSRKQEPDKVYVLRLRYLEDFRTAGRREDFVDPQDWCNAGKTHWPNGVRGFKLNRTPPGICLEGTYGFHSDLHKDRDGRKANLNRLLMEIQRCLNA